MSWRVENLNGAECSYLLCSFNTPYNTITLEVLLAYYLFNMFTVIVTIWLILAFVISIPFLDFDGWFLYSSFNNSIIMKLTCHLNRKYKVFNMASQGNVKSNQEPWSWRKCYCSLLWIQSWRNFQSRLLCTSSSQSGGALSCIIIRDAGQCGILGTA